MSDPRPAPTRRRVLAVFDSASVAELTFVAAADVAIQLQAELEARLFEDERLMQLARLPIGRQLALHSGVMERLDPVRLARELGVRVERARSGLARVAAARDLRWSLEVVRRPLGEILAEAASLVDLIVLERGPLGMRSGGLPVGGCAVLWLGPKPRARSAAIAILAAPETEASRVLAAVHALVGPDQPLRVFVPKGSAVAALGLARPNCRVEASLELSLAGLRSALSNARGSVVVLSRASPLLRLPGAWAELERVEADVLLVE